MATTYQDNGGAVNGSNKIFTFPFPKLKDADVKVSCDGVDMHTGSYDVDTPDAGKIQFKASNINSTYQEASGAPKSSVTTVRVYRDTGVETVSDRQVTFAAGSAIRAGDLNNMYDHFLYAAQEEQNLPQQISNDDVILGAEIAVSKLGDGLPRQLLQTNADNTTVAWTSDVDVPGTLDVTGATVLDSTLNVAGNTVLSGTLTVSGTTNLAASSIGTSEIADNAIVNTKIAVNAVETDNISNDAVTYDKLADNSVGSAMVLSSAITSTKIADDAVTNAKIGPGAVGSTELWDTGVTTSKLANNAVTDAKVATGAAIAHTKLAGATAGKVLLGNSSNVVTATTLSGDVTINSSGVTAFNSGDFGSKNLVTTGNVDLPDNSKVLLGTGDDLEIYHNGTDSYITNKTGSWLIIDNDSGHSVLRGASNVYIQPSDGEAGVTAVSGGGVLLYYDNAAKLETVSSGVLVNGNCLLYDNHAAKFGTSQDMSIYHDGSNSYIRDVGTGSLFITGSSTVIKNAADNQKLAEFTEGGSVDLYHNSAKKFETTSSGVTVSGTVDADNITGTSVVTSGTSTSDTKVYSAKRSDELYFNKASVEEITSGETWAANDTAVATTAAIDARIVDLVDDVGGFVPIANETSFPNANPDVNNGAGTLVSIKALASNLVSNGSGVATIANGTVGNSTVTITGLANSTTYAATFGMIVETTTTLNTYTFHRQTPKATEVTTVAGSISNVNTVAGAISNVNAVAGNATNINTVAGANSNITSVAGSIANVNEVADNMGSVNDFAARYRTGANNPTSSLDTGDLFFNTSANELKVYNGSAWQGGVTATGNFASITGNTFTGDNLYNDGVKTKWGTGSDLQIYHDGTNAYIKSETSGHLYLDAQYNVYIRDQDGSENRAVFDNDGAVELYYDGAKKFETTSTGVKFTGNLTADDNNEVRVGTGGDLQLLHNGTDSYITNTTGVLYIRGGTNSIQLRPKNDEWAIVAAANGGVEIAYDGAKKFETTSAGVTLTGGFIKDGSNDPIVSNQPSGGNAANPGLQIKNNGTINGSWRYDGRLEIGGQDGDAEIKLDPAGHIYILNDSGKVQLGTGQDLQIYHDGSHSIISDSGTGQLRLTGSHVVLRTAAYGEVYQVCTENGSVDLYYDNVKKFETTSIGIDVTGIVQCDEFKLLDGEHAKFGTGEDLRIYHDGTNSRIHNATGALIHRTASYYHWYNTDASETLAQFNVDGSCDLYHNGIKALNTCVNGAQVWASEGNDASLYILADEADDLADQWRIRAASAAQLLKIEPRNSGGSYESSIVCTGSGETELYYDNAKKINTNSTGVYVTGNVQVGGTGQYYGYDNTKVVLGHGSDLQIYHDGSNSWIRDTTGTNQTIIEGAGGIDFRHYSTGEMLTRMVGNGAVELYYDNVKKLETWSNGVKVLGDLWLDNATNAGQDIFWDESASIFNFEDGVQATFGDSGDLQLYHNGSYSFLNHSGTGNLYIRNSTTNADLEIQAGLGGELILKVNAGEKCAQFNTNGSSELYYDASKKLETASHGTNIPANNDIRFVNGTWTGDCGTGTAKIQCHGNHLYLCAGGGKHIFRQSDGTEWAFVESSGILPGANNTYNLGSSGSRWANLYVNDMHFSNEGKTNDVDGTWGDWTLQEGEDDIFMLNNRTGKKYKMALQEVS